ncbi:MAG: M48 family metalloprotease [Treponema sp.]|jgi:predicted Zn-dependent protease|nr:M48 family metalloprotease [Treponema sp.]
MFKQYKIFLFLFICFTFFQTGPVTAEAEQEQNKGKPPAPGANAIQRDMFGALSQMNNAIQAEEEAEFTPEDNYHLGRSVGANVLAAYPVWDNPALVQYLDKICTAITVNSSQPEIFNGYHVILLDSGEINAFATPGGHILISRGLVTLAGSEDALAAIIAHEVAHIQLKHGAEIINNMRLVQGLNDTSARALDIASRDASPEERKLFFNMSVRNLADTLMKNGYSQSQEFDADKYALSLLSSAGYDPRSLIEVLRVMEKSQPNHPGGFSATHPAPALRITNVEPQLRQYRITDTSSFRQKRFRNR